MLHEMRQLLQSIKRRKIDHHGHVVRKDSCLKKDITQVQDMSVEDDRFEDKEDGQNGPG